MQKIFQKLQGAQYQAILARSSLSSLVLQVVGTVLSFAIQVLLVRLIGVTQFGYFAYSFTWLKILALIGSLGLNMASLRFVAAYHEKKEWALLKGFISKVYQIGSISGVLLGVGTSFCLWLLRSRLEPELRLTFVIGCMVIPFLILVGFRTSILRALKHVVYASFPEYIFRPVLFSLLLGLIWYGRPDLLKAPVAMFLHVLTYSAAFLLGELWVQRCLPHPVKQTQIQTVLMKEWIGVALPMLLISGMQLVQSQTDILMLGMLTSTREAGIYVTLTNILSPLIFGLAAVNSIVPPLVSQCHATNQHDKLQHIMTLAAKGIFFFTLITAFTLILCGKWILLLFGQAFLSGYSTLLVMIAGQMINALAGSVGFLMTMTGRQSQAAMILAFCTVGNILLNSMLIPKFGMMGAAVATALTTILWNVAMYLYVQKHLQIDPTIFSLLRRKR